MVSSLPLGENTLHSCNIILAFFQTKINIEERWEKENIFHTEYAAFRASSKEPWIL